MNRLQAFLFEVVPNGEQQRDMRRFAGSRRFVYNKGLALQIDRYAQGEKRLSYVEMYLGCQFNGFAVGVCGELAVGMGCSSNFSDFERACPSFEVVTHEVNAGGKGPQ
jgi:transposase